LTPMLDFTPASSMPLRGSEIARSRLASREEAWQVPVVYLHCNDLRSEHRCTQKPCADPQAHDSAAAPIKKRIVTPYSARFRVLQRGNELVQI